MSFLLLVIVLLSISKLEEYSETEWLNVFENSKKKDDLADCYLQALTYIMFKSASVSVKNKMVTKDKMVTKKELKDFLDNLIKKCSVNEDFKTINEIDLPKGITIEHLTKWSMKKYLKFNYL